MNLNSIRENYYVKNRTDVLFKKKIDNIRSDTSKFFAYLLFSQWLISGIITLILSSEKLSGNDHILYYDAKIILIWGLVINCLPIYLSYTKPTATITRHSIALSQMLWSGILIQLSGGRIETHFHIFASLAFLAFYRDWKVLLTGGIVITFDHILRGVFFPLSIFGVDANSYWRTFEHSMWILFEVSFLSYSCIRMAKELRTNALRQATLEDAMNQFNRKTQEETVLREDLQNTLKNTEAAHTAKSAFLAHMSHEIRTPLNGIYGSLQIISKEQLSTKQNSFVNVALKSFDALSSILNDVLDLSKIESGKMELVYEYVDIREIVSDVINIHYPKALEKGINLNSLIDIETPDKINVDKVKLRQILINLVSNAVKFTDSGYVLIKVNSYIIGKNICSLRFDIIDTGVGIKEEKIATLFDPFVQGDISTTKAFSGSGLGLAICKELAQLMNSEIKVKINPTGGSIFSFKLEVAMGKNENLTSRFFKAGPSKEDIILADQNIIKDKKNKKSFNSKSNLKVLLAEDNEINQLITVEFLTKLGIEAVVVENGELALEKIKREEFDIVFLDYHMPVLDGLEASIQIKKHEKELGKAKEVPIVVLTADVISETKEKFKEVGVEWYLIKPLDIRNLESLIKKIFGGSLLKPSQIDYDSLISKENINLIDLEALTKRYLNNKDLVLKILSQFKEQ